MECNVREINIVSRYEDLDAYRLLLQDGKQWGVSIEYVLQDEPNGIVDAVKKCAKNLKKDSCMICLGDNFIYQQDLPNYFTERELGDVGAIMLCMKRDYGHLISTIEFDDRENVLDIVRVYSPKDKYISPGIFLYDELLWEILFKMADDVPWVEVNKCYMKEKMLKVIKLQADAIWHDVGVPNERLRAEQFIEKTFLHSKKLIGCPEEIAFRKGWISKEEYDFIVRKMPNCQYKTYLENIKVDVINAVEFG